MASFRRLLIRLCLSPGQRKLFKFASVLALLTLTLWFMGKLPAQQNSVPGESEGRIPLEDTSQRPKHVDKMAEKVPEKIVEKVPPVPQTSQQKLQAKLDYLAEKMEVSFETVSNLGSPKASINLRNTGTEIISQWNWSLYLYSQRSPRGGHRVLANQQIVLEHVHGGLHRLSPSEKFQGILPGKSLAIIYTAPIPVAARTDVFPNWFVASPGLEAKVVASTAGETLSFVKPFDSEAKWKRDRIDLFKPFSPEFRYTQYAVRDFGSAESLIVPTPFHVSYDKSRSAVIDDTWVIVVQGGAGEEAEREAKLLSEKLGLKTQNDIPEDHYILLSLDGTSFTADQRRNPDEAYNLKTLDGGSEKILIDAQTSRGLFYGIQSLLNMMDLDTGAVFSADVQDVPRYPYRGLMVDVGRNFLPKEEVLKIIEAMATYKLNKFHFHLADDEGWRLQIPGLEELTEVGVRKGFDLQETTGLLPFLGSDPTSSVAASGFYTVDDYKAILEHAESHHVTVIPEFDMPGHAHAAIKAMEVRERRLTLKNQGEPYDSYLLSDPEDMSKYESVQMFQDNAINPCLDSTYKFVEHIITKVVEMHKNIQKLETFHFGGDEVPAGSLRNSPACGAFRKDNPTIGSLKDYFIERVYGILAKHGLQPQGWEDAFYSKRTSLNKKIAKEGGVINAWFNVWESGLCYRTYETANAGFKVVLTHATHLYLDHPQEPDPEERGLYWATRYIDTQKVFSYSPEDIYSNMDFSVSGDPLSRKHECNRRQCTPLQKQQNIIGMEGAAWGETIRTSTQLDYMVFPRILAVAERAWNRGAWETEDNKDLRLQKQTEDWAQFANALGYRELRRLEKLGIEYRLPVPGAVKEDGKLKVMSEFPGVPIQYSTDGGATWNDWKEHDDHTALSGRLLLASRSFDGKRRSRSVEVDL